jgi:hypothetical protein
MRQRWFAAVLEMYVFKPRLGGVVVYVKVIVRINCVVISFHEEEDQIDEDN